MPVDSHHAVPFPSVDPVLDVGLYHVVDAVSHVLDLSLALDVDDLHAQSFEDLGVFLELGVVGFSLGLQ